MIKHNYAIKIDKLITLGLIDAGPGVVSSIEVRHDNSCGVYSHKLCNCNPDIIVNGVLMPDIPNDDKAT